MGTRPGSGTGQGRERGEGGGRLRGALYLGRGDVVAPAEGAAGRRLLRQPTATRGEMLESRRWREAMRATTR